MAVESGRECFSSREPLSRLIRTLIGTLGKARR